MAASFSSSLVLTVSWTRDSTESTRTLCVKIRFCFSISWSSSSPELDGTGGSAESVKINAAEESELKWLDAPRRRSGWNIWHFLSLFSISFRLCAQQIGAARTLALNGRRSLVTERRRAGLTCWNLKEKNKLRAATSRRVRRLLGN